MAETAAAAGRQILVTGATGFIGRHLIARLRAGGDAVIALSRQPTRAQALLGAGVRCVGDLARLPRETRIDAVVNLAGARILGPPWTQARRQVLRESRLATTRAVVALCARLGKPPEVVLSASAVGYYGVHGDEPLDETAPPQGIFQSRLCSDWEELAGTVGAASRVILLRLGVVLGRDGGALPQLARPVRMGLGSVLASGRQWAPWIHLQDALRLIEWALCQPGLSGPLNAVAPQAVTHAEMQATLGRVLNRRIWLRVPALLLRSMLSEMAQLLVDGQRVVPQRALAAGFEFGYPRLEPALVNLLRPPCVKGPKP